MFEVLAFVYENYWGGDACPEWDHLERKLNSVGFEADEIADALAWLGGLKLAAQGTLLTPDPALPATEAIVVVKTAEQGRHLAGNDKAAAQSTDSLRIYSVAEQDHLGAECLGFIAFLDAAGVLPAPMREIVLDRAMAASCNPPSLDDLKIIILMVYWSFDEEPDALVLDELCDDSSDRVAH